MQVKLIAVGVYTPAANPRPFRADRKKRGSRSVTIIPAYAG